MTEFFRGFFDGSYAPHGYCLLWQPELIWTHVISDALIAAAYFSIPVALLTFVRRRRDVEFGKMFWLFALFILSCGLTHVMGIWNLWNGHYGVEAGIKAVTALASVPTALLLWPLLPKALAIPSPSQLQTKNEELAAALAERDGALQQLRAEVQHRERAEAALIQSKKIEAIGQLTGGIAHDFNNLLQAIAGNLELISVAPDKQEKVSRWAGNALSAVERGTKLTGQLLTFSRQQRIESRAIPVGNMIEGLRELLRNSVGPTVNIEFDIAPDVGVVSSDPTQLELAVLNLSINARDAMPSGGTLTIAAYRQRSETGEERVAIEVRDTGVGMSPEVLEHALEPFYTTKGPGRGTGLGLSMVYGLAQQAGGDLLVESEVGRGTTVTMLLPAQEEVAVAVTSDARADTPLRPATARRILLVDDDSDVRLALADMLSSEGHHVLQAEDGVQALALIERDQVDLLLTDFAMPDMDGAALAERARTLRPELQLLFITGFADSEALDAAVAGRARVLKKPVSSAELAAAIREMLA